MKTDEEQFMKQALKLAEKGKGQVSPNPMVGCVLVKNGKVIGQGYHKAFGRSHAEVEALGSVLGKRDNDIAPSVTMYVTLEPCCTQGRLTGNRVPPQRDEFFFDARRCHKPCQ